MSGLANIEGNALFYHDLALASVSKSQKSPKNGSNPS